MFCFFWGRPEQMVDQECLSKYFQFLKCLVLFKKEGVAKNYPKIPQNTHYLDAGLNKEYSLFFYSVPKLPKHRQKHPLFRSWFCFKEMASAGPRKEGYFACNSVYIGQFACNPVYMPVQEGEGGGRKEEEGGQHK